MHLPQLITSLATLLPRAQAPEPTDCGHWRLVLYETWSPTGSYSKTSIYSEYWTPAGTLGGIVYCADEHFPDSRGHVHTPCNDTSFSCTSDANLYEIKQTVDLGGKRVPLVGRKNVNKTRSAAGTTLQADVLIDATLVEDKAAPM